MSFFKKLLDSKDPLSSKRFISLVALALLVFIVISIFFGKTFPDSLIISIVSLITAGIGATLLTNNNNV